MYGWSYGDGEWWMLAAMLLMALAVLGSVWLVTHRPGAPTAAPIADDVLRLRYARGEITWEQFEEAKGVLASQPRGSSSTTKEPE
jgi:uncharacterized membrane protein